MVQQQPTTGRHLPELRVRLGNVHPRLFEHLEGREGACRDEIDESAAVGPPNSFEHELTLPSEFGVYTW